jgi:hypothetical protein
MRTIRLCVHIIKLPNPISNMTILKIVILIISKIESEFWNYEELDFWQSAKAPHECCPWMTVTIAMVMKIICMSRRWKANKVSYRIGNQTSPCFTYLGPLNLRFHPYVHSVQKVQHRDLSLKACTVEPCIRWDYVSNQRKAELVSNNFGIQSFQGCHGKISPRDQFMPKG